MGFSELKQELIKNKISFLENQSMKDYTTFEIGGNCEVIACPKSLNELKVVMLNCKEKQLPYFILGKGSNLLVSDKGCNKICISTSNLTKIKLVDETTIYCESGVSVAKLCKFALENNLSGLEFAFGIPGSVGGGIYMNAGAYGGEMKDVVSSSEYINSDGEIKSLKGKELDFSYRHSAFCNMDVCITSSMFSLKKEDVKKIKDKMYEFLGRRKDKQPLSYPSAGSTFKRPEGAYASALIEECELKGLSVGGAQVSKKHSGFVINTGGATCEDVEELIKLVQKEVFEKTGFKLETEVKRLD